MGNWAGHDFKYTFFDKNKYLETSTLNLISDLVFILQI